MKTRRILLTMALVVLCVEFSHGSAEDIEINEVVSSNNATIADENGDYSDWIELHNTGTTPVDLAGWGLTDLPATPFKWVLPARTLEPDAYLLVWASSKDRALATGSLHTNFGVSASGESLALTEPLGTTIDLVAVPPLPPNVSYGRKPGEGDRWFYFETPTPEAANTTPGYPDLATPPTFSQPGGFYTAAFSLDISTQPGWTIYYTLDGSDPDPARVGAGAQPYRVTRLYSAPVSVASRAGEPNVYSQIPTTAIIQSWLASWHAPAGEVFKCTVIRAIAHDPATGRSSKSVTRTYFVDPNIFGRYGNLPVISLVSDYNNLFADSSGIYVPGNTHGGAFEKQNFFQGWAKPASIELFESNGTPGFNGVYEISNQGATSPASPQKALHVIARAEFGPEMINYPLFAGAESRANKQTVFKRFVLRSWGSALNWPVFFSDAYQQLLAATADQEIQDYRPVVVFINGEYWGLHEIREHNKSSWYHQARTGINRDDPGFDMLEEGEIDEGDDVHWNETMAYINTHDLADDTCYDYVTTRIDVANFAEYMVHCTFTGKRDWPGQNEGQWRPRTPDGRWRWVQWDMDHGLNDYGAPEHDMLHQVLHGDNGYGPHPLLLKLLHNARFKAMFLSTYADWLNSRGLRSVELARFDAMKASFDPFIAEYDNRWPDTHNWSQTGYGRDILSRRNGIRRTQLRNTFNLGADRTVSLDADSAQGVIRCNRLVVDAGTPGVSNPPYPWTGMYFQNLPVTLEAMPRDGYKFVGWHVRINGVEPPPTGADPAYYSQQASIPLTLAGPVSAEAVFEIIPTSDLHTWTFEGGTDPYPPTFTVGGGTLSVTPSANTSVSAASQGFLTSHLRVNNPIGTIVQWALPTTGYQAPRLTFLTRRSGSGAGTQTLSYTVDGTSWTVVSTYSVNDADPQAKSFSFSGIETANDNPDFAVRIEFTQGSGGTSGNNRFDDVALKGVVIPPTFNATIESTVATGVNITVSPPDQNGQSDGTTGFTRSYFGNTSVTLTAPVTSGGYRFQKWLEDGIDLATSPAVTVTMDGHHTFTAGYIEVVPAITVQPKDIAVAEGGGATFEVTATGTGTLRYQWRFDGSDIPDTDASSYTIDSVTPDHIGSYDVVVSNAVGPVTSSPARLTILPSGLVNGSFEDGYDGWTHTGHQSIQSMLPYAAADGTKLVSFNSGNEVPNAVLSQSFATTPGRSYLLAFDLGILSYNSSQQRVQVDLTGSSLLASQTYTLARAGGTLIRWEPKQFSFTANSTTTTLAFRDISPATIALDVLLDNVRIIYQVTRTLTVESQLAEGVNIGVSPADSSGQSTGTTRFTRSYPDATQVTLTAPAANSGYRFLKWQRKGIDLALTPVASVKMDGNHTLTAVYVEGPPVITIQPASQAAGNGNSVTFQVTAEGTGTLAYQWRFNGTDIAGANGSSYGIANATEENAGTYDVVVSNAVGQVTSTPATLTIVTTTLLNGSFEADYTGWTHTGNQLVLLLPATDPYVASDGVRIVVFNKSGTTPNAVLSQSFATTPGQFYQLRFNMGILAYNDSQQRMRVDIIGSSLLVSQTFTMVRSGGAVFRAVERTMNFTANSTTTTLAFRDVSGTTDSVNMTLDNVRVEPGTPPANAAPVAVAESYPATRDTQLTVPAPGVLGNDSDADANPLTAVPDTGTGHGVVTLNPNGSFTYTPAAGYTGSDSFTYHASDGSLDSNVVTVSITVRAPATSSLVNGSFEADHTGWTQSGNQRVKAGVAPHMASNGSKYVTFNSGNAPPNGVLSQTFSTVAGAPYTLAFDAGILDYVNQQQRLQCLVDGTTNLANRMITLQGQATGTNRWTLQSVSFVANSASTTLTFRDVSTTTNAVDMLLDNIRITGATPSGALMPAGTASLMVKPSSIASEPVDPGNPSLSGIPGDFTIRMTASRAGDYVLECSEDLRTWAKIGEQHLPKPGIVEFHDRTESSGPEAPPARRFYRIGLLPENISR